MHPHPPKTSTALTPEAAWETIAASAPTGNALRPPATATVPRAEALGARLARALRAEADLPATDVSAMDGFAIDSSARPGTPLEIAGTIAAGDPPGAALPPGGNSCLRIMTGAPVPAGADRVIPVERSRPAGREGVTLLETILETGANIRRQGEILRRGAEALPNGALLHPAALALAASQGATHLEIHRRPTVAVLPTGDEVVPASTTPGLGQLRDTHTDFLLAAGRAGGRTFHALGIAPDRPERLRELLAQGLEHDVLLVCGGVSEGEFDFVEPELAALGCKKHFTAVAIQPGRPLVFASHENGYVFGLPGNPNSAIVAYHLFVEPLLRRLEGDIHANFWDQAQPARLTTPLPAGHPNRDRFLPATVHLSEGILQATPHIPQGSHDLQAHARGASLVRIRAGAAGRGVGEECEVLR